MFIKEITYGVSERRKEIVVDMVVTRTVPSRSIKMTEHSILNSLRFFWEAKGFEVKVNRIVS